MLRPIQVPELHDVPRKVFYVSSRPHEVCLSYNGGKDCTLLLFLLISYLRTKYPHQKLPVFYQKQADAFPEIDEFVSFIVERYPAELMVLSVCAEQMKDGLAIFLQENPHLKAIMVGTRYDDPHSDALQPFKATDKDWPQIMRVYPILKWKYDDIWAYLLDHELPYCCLYDQGYTSLGTRSNTRKNELLRRSKSKGAQSACSQIADEDDDYLPAYRLTDASTERDGRTT